MKRNVLEYAATDKFITLFLTASDNPIAKQDGLITIMRDQFDPDVVAEIEANDDDYGIPDVITITNAKFNVDADSQFHGHPTDEVPTSFSCDLIQLLWCKDPEGERTMKHRTDGPAIVELRDFSTTHANGVRRGFSTGSWNFGWYIDGEMSREGGPHWVNGDAVNAVMHPDGTFRTLEDMTKIQARFAWNHPAGGNITADRVVATVQNNEVVLNQLSPLASVFDNEMEQAVFYTTIFD